jgi:hypothetical protein
VSYRRHVLAHPDTLRSAKELLARATRSLVVTVDAAGRPCASTLDTTPPAPARVQIDRDRVRVVVPDGAPHAENLERDPRMAIVAIDERRPGGGSMVLLGRASRGAESVDGALQLRVEHVRAGVSGWSVEDLAAWRQG